MRYSLLPLCVLLLLSPLVTCAAEADPSVSNAMAEDQAAGTAVSNRHTGLRIDGIHRTQKTPKEIEAARSASAAVSNALSEIQEAWNTVSNRQTLLHAVGLKYKDSKEIEVAGFAHAALIGANDPSSFSNLLSCLRGASQRETEAVQAASDVSANTNAHMRHVSLTNWLTRFSGAHKADPNEVMRLSSLVSLYVRSSRSPTVLTAVRTAVSNELALLYADNTRQGIDKYRSWLLGVVLGSAPEIVPSTWLHSEIASFYTNSPSGKIMLLRNLDRADSALRELASRGDPMIPDVVSRLRQLDEEQRGQQWDGLLLMYRIASAKQPEEIVKEAMLSGDEALEEWCILFIDKKRLTSLLPYAEERGKSASPMLKSLYRQLAADLRDPKQKAPLGSDANPIILPEEFAPRQPQGKNTNK